MHDNLEISIDATLGVLRDRLRTAQLAHAGAHGAREDYPQIDTFLASTSRHMAAISAALLPVVRNRLEGGDERAREFVGQSRRLELTLVQVKAKAYGEAHAIHRSWQEVWRDMVQEFESTLAMERAMVDDLVGHAEPDELDELAMTLYHAELHSPTRPHPHAPHLGLTGRVARRMLNTVDRFWDTTEGRMIPEPPHPLHHNGKIAHYLLADVDPDDLDEPES